MYATIICQTYKIKYTDKTPQEPVKLLEDFHHEEYRSAVIRSEWTFPCGAWSHLKLNKSPDDPETRLLPTG